MGLASRRFKVFYLKGHFLKQVRLPDPRLPKAHTSQAAMGRNLVHARAAAAAGDYDLLLYYMALAAQSAPQSHADHRRVVNLYARLKRSRCRDWFIRLVRKGYRPVWRPE